MSKDPRVYLAHILECIQKIERFTAPGKRRFLRDELIQDAVRRNLEAIGEAAKRLDEHFRAAHPEIPWRAMAGLRACEDPAAQPPPKPKKRGRKKQGGRA